ncbi:MAG: CvpA family protein [Bacteroidota bacterium]
MNVLDIILLCFVGLMIFNGIRKGFIISLAGLIALILGIYAAVHFSNYISRILSDNFHPSGTWLPILSFSLTFLIVVILVMLVAKVVEKVVTIAGMGFLNRLAGALFGLLKAVLIASVLLFIITSVDSKEKLITPKTKRESVFFSYVAKTFPRMLKLVGGEIKFTKYDFKF